MSEYPRVIKVQDLLWVSVSPLDFSRLLFEEDYGLRVKVDRDFDVSCALVVTCSPDVHRSSVYRGVSVMAVVEAFVAVDPAGYFLGDDEAAVELSLSHLFCLKDGQPL